MPFKVILNVDPETGEADDFLWTEKEEPPPLVRPRILYNEELKEDKMIKAKLCFFFIYISDGDGFYRIHKILLTPKNTIPQTTLISINDEDKLPFVYFKLKYENCRIEGAFKVTIADRDYIIDPITRFARQTKNMGPGAITQFEMPLCIDLSA